MAVNTPISDRLRLFGTHKADYAELAIGRVDVSGHLPFSREDCLYLVLRHHHPTQKINRSWSVRDEDWMSAGWKHVNKATHFHYVTQATTYLDSIKVKLQLTSTQLRSVGLPPDLAIHLLVSPDLPKYDLARYLPAWSIGFLAWAQAKVEGNPALGFAAQGPYHPITPPAWEVIRLNEGRRMLMAGPASYTILGRAEFETIPGHRDAAAQKLLFILMTRLPHERDPMRFGQNGPDGQSIWRSEDMLAQQNEIELFAHNVIDRREVHRSYISRDGKLSIGLLENVTRATFNAHRFEWILNLIDLYAMTSGISVAARDALLRQTHADWVLV